MAIDKPFTPWTKGDDITAARLNEMQGRPIVDVRVGKNMRMLRQGNSVTLDAIMPDAARQASTIIWVKVVSNATGGGKYIGRVMTEPVTGSISESSNMAEGDLGTAGTVDVLICNAAEIGLATHKLTAGTPVIKYFPAKKHPIRSNAATPKDVYFITGIDVEACT